MLYNVGLDLLGTVVTGGGQWILLKGSGYEFDPDHVYVADLDPASNEVTVAGYERVPTANAQRVVNNTLNRIEYKADNPNFGTMAGGETVTALVLSNYAGNDAGSVLVGYWQFTGRESDLIDPFIVYFDDRLITYLAEG